MDHIYRIQNKDGIGPYYSGVKFSFMARHNGSKKHPSPDQDSILQSNWAAIGRFERHFWKFGFESLDQLHKWFTVKNLAELQEAGFFITLVPSSTITGVIKSKHQVLYKVKRRWALENFLQK